MVYLFLTLALLNTTIAALTGNGLSLCVGISLGVLACLWAAGESSEPDYADEV